MFVEGQLPHLRPLVLQVREDRSRSSYLDFLAQPRSKGNAFIAKQQLRPFEKKEVTF